MVPDAGRMSISVANCVSKLIKRDNVDVNLSVSVCLWSWINSSLLLFLSLQLWDIAGDVALHPVT